MSVNHISKFVLDFIEANKNNANIRNDWCSDNTQKKLKKMFKKLEPSDPLKPKRGKTSFLLFCDDYRENVIKDNPGIKGKDVPKKLAELWKDLKDNNPDLFKEYENRSLEQRNKYKENKDLYLNKITVKDETKSSQEVVDNRYKNYYIVKFKKLKNTNPELTDEQIDDKIKTKWNKISEKDKNKYA